MTFGIISESDREGRAVCQFWLPGGKHNVTPTDKNTFRRESPWGPLDHPGRRNKVLQKTQHKRDSNRLGGEDREMSPAATMGPALCKLSA